MQHLCNIWWNELGVHFVTHLRINLHKLDLTLVDTCSNCDWWLKFLDVLIICDRKQIAIKVDGGATFSLLYKIGLEVFSNIDYSDQWYDMHSHDIKQPLPITLPIRLPSSFLSFLVQDHVLFVFNCGTGQSAAEHYLVFLLNYLDFLFWLWQIWWVGPYLHIHTFFVQAIVQIETYSYNIKETVCMVTNVGNSFICCRFKGGKDESVLIVEGRDDHLLLKSNPRKHSRRTKKLNTAAMR